MHEKGTCGEGEWEMGIRGNKENTRVVLFLTHDDRVPRSQESPKHLMKINQLPCDKGLPEPQSHQAEGSLIHLTPKLRFPLS